MANVNNPRGLFPITQPGGNIKVNLYKAVTDDAIYRYDPVVLASAGKVGIAPKGDNAYVLGVVIGFTDNERAGLGADLEKTPYLPKDKEGYYCIVCDDPEQLYLIQSDTGGGNLSLTNVGNSCGYDWLQAASGNTTTGISKLELDTSDAAADTAGSLRIVDFWDAVDNTTGSWCKVVVKLNRAQGAPTAVGQNI